MQDTKHIKMDMFGKDHWSLLGYVECCCVDSNIEIGILNNFRMRVKTNDGSERSNSRTMGPGWKPEYGTRLKGFFEKNDPNLQLTDHDDMDCLNDLEDAGLIEILSMANLYVKMTPLGCKVAAQLREHKANGGYFSNFEYKA